LKLLVPDNTKVAIIKACLYEPQVNRTYADLAAHYHTAILPARPRRPRDKAKVEAAVLIVERWLLGRLRHRRFYSLAELNAAIAELLQWLNEERPIRRLGVTPGGGNLFFQLVNARYEKGAMILTSNRGFAEWGDVFGDPVVATALLDRLLHHAVVIQIEGSSYRMRQHADLVPDQVRSNSPLNPPPAPKRRGRPPRQPRWGHGPAIDRGCGSGRPSE
jgi:hypothetical protein